MAPYVLATQLEQNNFDTVVIDYFTRIPNFFQYLENFLDSSTLFIGISSTFLSRSVSAEVISRSYHDLFNLLGVNRKNYSYRGDERLWQSTIEALDHWLLELKRLMKKHCPKARLVLGGARTEASIRVVSNMKHFDYYAVSYSDISIVNFAKSLKSESEPKFFLKNGLRILDNREFLPNKICPETMWRNKYAVLPGESLPIEISRGCVFNCKFCFYDTKQSVRKDLNLLKQEFIRNYEMFGTTVYHFCDDCFNDSRKKVEDTCDMILNLPFQIEWISYARVDVAVRFPDTLRLMIESGARGLFFGLESFNYVVAKNAGKSLHPDKVKQFLLEFREKYSGRCLIDGSFITGLPGETSESINETIAWVVDNRALDFVSVGPLVVADGPIIKQDQGLIRAPSYSVNPKKYGFKTDKPHETYQWEHETMTSKEAIKLADEFSIAWINNGHKTAMRSIWTYPILRSLGFTHTEITDMAKNELDAKKWIEKIVFKFQAHNRTYWEKLLIENS
jgi:hypothetical protein